MNRFAYLTAGFFDTLQAKPGLLSVVWQGPLACALLVLAGCGGGGVPLPAVDSVPVDGPADLEVQVADVTELPIEGASVTVVAAGVAYQRTTGASGTVGFPDLPTREVNLSVSAAGFEGPGTGATATLESGLNRWQVTLPAIGAWAIGRPIVLGTRMVDVASDGSAMTFSLDVAVIGESSEAIETLTSADFSVATFDCGWFGSRACASDAAGNATGVEGSFSPNGGAQAFGLQLPSARHPYLVGVLAERSAAVTDWDAKVPALKSFFTALGGNDAASLASVQTENGSATLTVFGPFTSDGTTYLNAIDQLAEPAGSPPAILESLTESIRRAAAASSGAIPGTEPTVLVLATPGLTIPELETATALAQQLSVRISTIVREYDNYGFPELAVRTGGFVAEVADLRQLGMIFGAMDQLLAGTTRYYRMQFRVEGVAGTFVSGGNAKVWLRIRVPTPLPSNGVYTSLDVAIP